MYIYIIVYSYSWELILFKALHVFKSQLIT